MVYLGKVLLVIGVICLLLGIVFILFPKQYFSFFGRLPGDIIIHKKNFSFYFPITSCLIVSIILSLLFWLILRK